MRAGRPRTTLGKTARPNYGARPLSGAPGRVEQPLTNRGTRPMAEWRRRVARLACPTVLAALPDKPAVAPRGPGFDSGFKKPQWNQSGFPRPRALWSGDLVLIAASKSPSATSRACRGQEDLRSGTLVLIAARRTLPRHGSGSRGQNDGLEPLWQSVYLPDNVCQASGASGPRRGCPALRSRRPRARRPARRGDSTRQRAGLQESGSTRCFSRPGRYDPVR